MKESLKISIVTISFNQKRFLEESINSVFSQDYKNIEYIIVDPGSTDGSREVIMEHADQFSKIVFEPDKGPVFGLVNGFKYATGEVFCFLNSDDILLPGSLCAINDYFSNNPNTDVLFGNGNVIDEHGKLIKKIYTDSYSLRRFVYGNVTFIQPAVFFKKSAYKKVKGFNIKNNICWDGELFLDFGLHKMNIKRINKFLASFRLYSQSRSGSNTKQDEYLAVRNKLFEKTYKREYNMFDKFLHQLFRIEATLLNPRKIRQKF